VSVSDNSIDIEEDKNQTSMLSPFMRRDFPEILARRSFIIAKAHLFYLLRKEEDKIK
jgi:hypothetical protein